MKIRVQKKQIFVALLIFVYAIRGYTDAVYVARGIDSAWVTAKYVVLAVAILYGVCLLPKNFRLKGYTVIKNVSLTVAVFVFISSLRMVYAGIFTADIFMLAMHMLIPAVIAVLMVNILDSDEIYNCMSWILYVCFVFYAVFEIGLSEFTLENFSAISFSESYSPYESHGTSGTAMALCAYFCFNRKKRFNTILSFVFSLLTFKRMLVISSIVLFILPVIIPHGINVNRRLISSISISFVLGTLAYYWCLIPESSVFLKETFGIESLERLTSFRSVFFNMYYSDPFFTNFGWGSCLRNIGHTLEMDLIQIYVELTVIGLVVFIFMYWEFAGSTVYGVTYMLFNFLNMLTSHSIQNGYIWSLVLITFVQLELDTYGQKGNKRLQRRVKIRI